MAGMAEEVAPGVLRVRAANASPFTGGGTNSYVLLGPDPGVIDPGPDDPAHLDALLAALGGRAPAAIVVTHAHVDHSALAPALRRATGAPVLAWGDAAAGLRPLPEGIGGGGGMDRAFRPDRRLADGEALRLGGRRLAAIHAPGHMGNHLCLDDGRLLWTGDAAMGFASSLVSPPEGDMGDYMASLERLLALGPRRLLPGHGAAVEDGAGRLRDLLRHRREREAQVLAALAAGPRTAAEIADALYAGTAPGLRRAAARNVLAHLIHLSRLGAAEPDGALAADAVFRAP